MKKKVCIIGGGAAGFFCAANLDSSKYSILILEQSSELLQKVRVSGGGRCNVTHACFDPIDLTKNYPRGEKELKSVFSRFQPGDTMDWFQQEGVELKVEEDQRVFPVSDSSQTIINVLLKRAAENEVEIHTKTTVKGIEKTDYGFSLVTNKNNFEADFVVFATGSSPKSMQILENLGHSLVAPVPSLFSFNIQDGLIKDFPGTSFENAEISSANLNFDESGPLLITHWGLSGPVILRFSSWKAVELNQLEYDFEITVNFIGKTIFEAEELFQEYRQNNPKRTLQQCKIFDLTGRFWNRLITVSEVNPQKVISQISSRELEKILTNLCHKNFMVKGKSIYKAEFVTAGGVELKEINFKNMSSKILPNFYVAGEVLNIDAITGGFNFQACWSEAWLIAQDLNAK